MPLNARIFEAVGRLVVRLPHVRGRTRACLLLFDLLGLKSRHTFVQVRLTAPVPYAARLDLHSWLQRIAFLTGEYEAETVTFLLKLQQAAGRGGYMLDVGANIGLISIPFALSLAGEQAKHLPLVVSVEAVPDNAAALRHNIALNSAAHLISVLQMALGDRAGTVDIQVEGDLASGEGTGTANILPTGSTLDPNGRYECVRTPIEVVALDALLDAGQIAAGCSVVKIDTDGYDLKVLQGGRKFIGECRPVIFGEFSAHCLAWHGQSVDDVVAFADSLNYVVWQRRPGTKSPAFSAKVDHQTFAQDLMLVPDEQVTALGWCCR